MDEEQKTLPLNPMELCPHSSQNETFFNPFREKPLSFCKCRPHEDWTGRTIADQTNNKSLKETRWNTNFRYI